MKGESPELLTCILGQLVEHCGPKRVMDAVLENAEIAEMLPRFEWRFVTKPAAHLEYHWTARVGLSVMVDNDATPVPGWTIRTNIYGGEE